MRRFINDINCSIAAAIVFTLGFNLVATAQESAPPSDDELIVRQEPNQILSTSLLGSNVINLEDGVIGTLDDLLIDDDNNVVGAVVSVGGFMGFGAKPVALTWEKFKYRPDSNVLHVSVNRAAMKAAPPFRDINTVRQARELERQQQQSLSNEERLQQRQSEMQN